MPVVARRCATCSPMSCRSAPYSSSSRSAAPRPCSSRGLVEELERELGDLARVRPRASCSGGRGRAPTPAGSRAGRRDQSAGSWRPMASSTMPSRSAHSLTVSSSNSNSSIAVARNIEPATMRSTRRASRPSKRSRSAAGRPRISLCSGEELVARERQLVQRRGDVGRRGAPRPCARGPRACRCCRPTSLRLERRDLGGDRARATSTRWSRSACRSPFEIGSLCTSSAVRRPTPRCSLVAQCRPAGVADHDLEAAAAEVEAQRGRRFEHHRWRGSRRRSARASSRPLITSTVDAGLGLDAVDDLVAVGGAADRARGARERSRRRPRRRRAAGTGGPWRPPASAASVGDRAVAAHDVAEAEHLLLARERLEVAVGVDVGDEEVERVRPEVERGDPHDPRVAIVTGHRA